MLKNLRRATAVAALAASSLAFGQAQAAPLEACFVYVSPVGQAGWTYQHELGRLALDKALPGKVHTRRVEAVAEGADSERVMRDLALNGCGLIFATSFGYLEPALRVASEFPAVKFEHAGGYKTAPNLNTYNARWYEGRWLAGWLAGPPLWAAWRRARITAAPFPSAWRALLRRRSAPSTSSSRRPPRIRRRCSARSPPLCRSGSRSSPAPST